MKKVNVKSCWCYKNEHTRNSSPFSFSTLGPFTASVEVNGEVYQGMGSTKKRAKHAVAEKVLASLSHAAGADKAGVSADFNIKQHFV